MKFLSYSISSARPIWDGGRVLFEIIDDGNHIPCAISRGALEEISGVFCDKAASSLSCFVHARPRIEALALAKMQSRPDGVLGRVNLWVGDLDFLPPGIGPEAVRLKTDMPQKA
jgi:Protein of unknown function (DUF1488)